MTPDDPDGQGDEAVIRVADRPGDLAWTAMAHAEVYGAEWGWDTRFEVLVMRIAADFGAGHDDRRERVWIAEVDGERVGCVACVADDPTTARLRVLLVRPDGRGHGLGARLVDTCLDFARDAGYERIRLWTTSNLEAARRIYESRGFVLVGEEPHTDFTSGVTDQTWELALP